MPVSVCLLLIGFQAQCVQTLSDASDIAREAKQRGTCARCLGALPGGPGHKIIGVGFCPEDLRSCHDDLQRVQEGERQTERGLVCPVCRPAAEMARSVGNGR